METVVQIWRQLHWFAKWIALSLGFLVATVLAVKTGLWTPDVHPVQPPFDLKECRFALAEKDYPSVSFDELADDIQFEYRQACSRAALEYQGYVR